MNSERLGTPVQSGMACLTFLCPLESDSSQFCPLFPGEQRYHGGHRGFSIATIKFVEPLLKKPLPGNLLSSQRFLPGSLSFLCCAQTLRLCCHLSHQIPSVLQQEAERGGVVAGERAAGREGDRWFLSGWSEPCTDVGSARGCPCTHVSSQPR